MSESISWLVVGSPQVAAPEGSFASVPRLRLLPDPLEFRLLGPVEVCRGGERLAVGGRRQLAVLTILAIDAGRVVPFDRIVDTLWGENPPSGCRATVHAYVSKLRRILRTNGRDGADGDLLVTRNVGYSLEIDPEAIDARRFETLADRGRAALASGDAEGASRLLGQALAQWRGPAVASFADEPFAAPEIARLEELRLAVTEDRFDAALTLGRHREVVTDIDRLVAAHPFRERLRAQLMVALYRCGRQAEALRTYQVARRLLIEELGIDPSPALRGLEGAILRQDPDLEWIPPRQGARALAGDGPSDHHPVAETITFLRSDIAGITRLRSNDPTTTGAVLARHHELVARSILEHGGMLADESKPGSIVALFARADDALLAALALHQVLAGESWPEGLDAQVRIGLQNGEIAGRGWHPDDDPNMPVDPHHWRLGAA